MTALAELIPLSPPGWWGVAAVALLVLELLSPGVFLMWLGIAAGLVAVVLLVAPLSLSGQLLLFAALALVSVAIGWRWYRSRKPASQGELREPEMYLVGQAGTVTDPLRHGHGKVKVGGYLWLAEGPDLDTGAAVRVVAQKGTVLVVEKS